jgi:ribonuclease P protein component
MNKNQRLRRPRDFDAVYNSGKVEGNRILVVRCRVSGAKPSRVGFVTTKAVGGAVVRNRVKRRLRAIASASAILEGLDIVVSARRPAADESFASLGRSLRTLLNRAGALKGAGQEPE